MLRNLKSLPVYLLTISSLHYFNFSLNSQWDMYAVCFPTKSFLTIKIALQSSIILITCTGGWFISSTYFQMFTLAEVKVWDVKPYKKYCQGSNLLFSLSSQFCQVCVLVTNNIQRIQTTKMGLY